MKEKNYTLAHEQFRAAATYLPGANHEEAVNGFCESGVKLAEQKIADGRYAEAEAIVTEIIDERYDPNCRPALELLAHLKTPGYYNRTIGPKFVDKVEEVKKLLTDAEGYYQSGRYDLAFKKYEQVLALDPYNTAARRGEEQLDNVKYKYNEEAYNETRARSLWQVEKGWEEPVRQYGKEVGPLAEAFQKEAAGTADSPKTRNHYHSASGISRRKHSRGDRFPSSTSGGKRSFDRRPTRSGHCFAFDADGSGRAAATCG